MKASPAVSNTRKTKTRKKVTSKPKKAEVIDINTALEDDDQLSLPGEVKKRLNYYTKYRLSSGRYSKHSGDSVAYELQDLSLRDVIKQVAGELEVSQRSLKMKYGHLNPGHQRMCLGNLLRGHRRRLSKNSDDSVPYELQDLSLRDVIKKVAGELEVSQHSLKVKYGRLDPGHQRTCLTNVLRDHRRALSEESK